MKEINMKHTHTDNRYEHKQILNDEELTFEIKLNQSHMDSTGDVRLIIIVSVAGGSTCIINRTITHKEHAFDVARARIDEWIEENTKKLSITEVVTTLMCAVDGIYNTSEGDTSSALHKGRELLRAIKAGKGAYKD